MIIRKKTITIFGGTGFVGNYTVRSLAKLGAKINVVTRNKQKAADLRVGSSLGQINIVEGDIRDLKFVENIVAKSDIIINLVGIIYEKHNGDFAKLHAQFPEQLARFASNYKLKQFVHVSALSVDQNHSSLYASSKLSGEKAITENFDNFVILRPSVIFGIEDNFINQFAKLINLSPIVPLVLNGSTKLQPVYVGDIAAAITKIVQTDKYNGHIYEVGGPDICSIQNIVEQIMQLVGKKRILFKIPRRLSFVVGSVLEKLPNPLLTADQVKMLAIDNVTQKNAKTFYDLSIQPRSLDEIMPLMLSHHQDHSYHLANS